ncbi:MAG: class I SAM-dependent methyltransferase [Rhodospirillales bacterium]
MEKRTNREVLEEILDPAGKTVIDIGCGDGSLVRLLTRLGARVVGIEASPKQLSLARAAESVGDERYLQGHAQELPADNRSVDIVIFLNSLHHVNVDDQIPALKEAARVLRHGGMLYVSEPLAEGPYFELMRPVHDETEVRRRAYEVLGQAHLFGFVAVRELVHVNPVLIKDFKAFERRITLVNPDVRIRFDEQLEDLRQAFERLGERTADGRVFDQPMRVNVYTRR